MQRWSCVLAAALLASCGSDSGIRDAPRCDGVLNGTEQAVDDAFDADGDGFFDAADEQCQETYAAEDLDCDDGNGAVHPGAVETVCNGLDDDCDALSEDAPDADGDGATPCDGDCDDGQALVGPDRAEEACDGLDNDCDASTVDGDDADSDGYENCEDCDDDDASVNPASVEADCNGKDDDCNELTPDGEDFDGDGMISCFDCDDADPFRYPGAEEICEDGVDQDCDTLDASCPPPTWDGLWDTNAVAYSCASNSVLIDFDSISVVDDDPDISFTFVGGTQPGTTEGNLDASDGFDTTYSIPGLCTETYDFVGSFTSGTTFTATLTATFFDASGTGFGCLDCTNQSWTVIGSR